MCGTASTWLRPDLSAALLLLAGAKCSIQIIWMSHLSISPHKCLTNPQSHFLLESSSGPVDSKYMGLALLGLTPRNISMIPALWFLSV